MSECPFCRPETSRVFHDADPATFCMWDLFPVSPGHALVIPRRHVATWFEATRGEQASLIEGIEIARASILERHSPAGFNIGINVGAVAGQTVPHLHVHVIPRYEGDVDDPRGGVRWVIPEKANYLGTREPTSGASRTSDLAVPGGELPTPNPAAAPRVVGSNADPLEPHLLADLAQARSVDIAIAFVLEAGLERVFPYLEDVLRRGRLRILTGDYLDTTEPAALRRLMDFEPDAHNPASKIERRIFNTSDGIWSYAGSVGFHSKLWILTLSDERRIAYIGSSNLTRAALGRGVESNLRLDSVHRSESGEAVSAVVGEFGRLFEHPNTAELTHDWITAYEARRVEHETQRVIHQPAFVVRETAPEPLSVPEPNDIQHEALAALHASRERGDRAGLVVMATGLGKTWLAAFDSCEFQRILFVAHREEILGQARDTFRRIRPKAKLGFYRADERDVDADIVFASIQTLGKTRHLENFERDAFDYIVVDEFHHACATTYRRLIDHFEPSWLLGLTATPERTDGGDLLTLCDGNLVYRCDLAAGIGRDLLAPFHYFGVPDDVDYANIPWRNARFDPAALEAAVATLRRADNALEQWRKRGGERTLAFCVSQRHADFMALHFRAAGVRCVAVHAGPSSAPRARSLDQLVTGELQVVFAVDMFNEGVDVPAIDTVMMLRPTESRIVWLQQLGRGLRRAEGKDRLTVVDYIGNHRCFLQKPIALLGLPEGAHHVREALAAIEAGTLELPPGCEVTYELEALDILRSLLRIPKTAEALKEWYEDFRARFDARPDATETMRAGFDPGSARKSYGSWLRFVQGMGDLDEAAQGALDEAGEFLDSLETTPMTKSWKMLVLLAMIAAGKFPGRIAIEDLVREVRHHARRSRLLTADVGDGIDSDPALRKLLEDNPIAAWTGGAGTGGRAYFEYDGSEFGTKLDGAPAYAPSLSRLTREIADWRMARYLEHQQAEFAGAPRFVAKVSHANGRPMLFLPDRKKTPGIPEGWTKLEIDGQAYEANFVKIALNVMRRPGSEENELPGLLQGWFGSEAGSSGNNSQVLFDQISGGYAARALDVSAPADGPELWQNYLRPAIPALFGLEFSEAKWNVGFVRQGGKIFLFPTLADDGKPIQFRYANRFLSDSLFQAQSQNRTKRDGDVGRELEEHVKRGVPVYLFVRKAKKNGSKGAPFTYCGEVTFVRWNGDQPITIEWRLGQPIPSRLHNNLSVPRGG